MKAKDSFDKVFGDKNKIMFVFAHPDDAEIYCGGTIARLVEKGKSVKLIKMTTGNKGSRQEKISEENLSITREREDLRALQTLGLTHDDNINLDLGDGQVENSMETIGKLVKEIRKFKPNLIVTHNAEKKLIRDMDGSYYVNHRDHKNTGLSVIDAAYPYSRDILFFPEQIAEGLKSHTCTEFLFIDSWGDIDTVFIDVSDQIKKRTKAIACHKSQYSQKAANDSTNYFAKEDDGKRFEQFRYVIAD